MKNLRKWTALAAVMAMTATLFTGCGSTDAPASGATAPAAESTAAVATETGAEPLQQTASWQQTYRQS